MINSPKALERTVNKMYTAALFSKAGLLVPELILQSVMTTR